MWQVQCRVYGSGSERRWFVVRETADGSEFVRNERNLPLPYLTEQEADEKAAQLNDFWEQFDVRR